MRITLLVVLLFMPSLVCADKEVECMTRNIYHEARGESIAGQVKVALVTLNRVYSNRWPNTICGVVYQPYQFSWTLFKPTVTDRRSYERAEMIARTVIKDYPFFENTGATHYVRYDLHNKVSWTKKMHVVAELGRHVFYVE